MGTRLTNFAKRLRKDQTNTEKKLWNHLKSRQLNSLKFRRQQPIGQYIVDFVCFEIKLIIELDGGQHMVSIERDSKRDNWLRSEGFTVLRFWDNEVMSNIEGVLNVISSQISNHPPLSPPIEGGEHLT